MGALQDNLTAHLRREARDEAVRLELAAESCCATCGVSLHSGTQMEEAACDHPILINLNAAYTSVRCVRLERGAVFVNMDLKFDEGDFLRKIDMEFDEARELLDWLATRRGANVCAIHLRRVGFGLRGEECAELPKRHEIKRLVLSTGKESDLEAGRYYASHTHKGQLEDFWPVEMQKAKIQTVDLDMLGEASDKESDCEDECGSKSIRLKSMSDKMILERLDKYCVEKAGQVVQVNYPGARGPAAFLKLQQIASYKTFCTDNGGQCTRAALINSVHSLCGADAAKLVRRQGRFIARNLGGVSVWMEKNHAMYRLEIVRPPRVSELDAWVSNVLNTDAVFILRVFGDDDDGMRTDHCVVVDCARGVVLDSCEEYALKLQIDVIRGFVGDGVVLERIEEVRKMMIQPKSKKGRKLTRRTPADLEKKRLRKGK